MFESSLQNETQVLSVKNWTTNSVAQNDEQTINITFDRNDETCHKFVIALNGLETSKPKYSQSGDWCLTRDIDVA